MRAEDNFDWAQPDYTPIYRARMQRLQKIRSTPGMLAALRVYYREHISQFIEDWGVTIDTRNQRTDKPVILPFILFPKQREWLDFTFQNWCDNEFGLTEKSRDVGLSTLAMAFACSVCIFYRNMNVGFGSQKKTKVDFGGDPSALLYKGRQFMSHLPAEFRGSWDITKHAPDMRILFPDTQSSIIGECGDDIGRGGRTAVFFVDEAAHLERPQDVDAALSANTECRQDFSSVHGMANPFAEKRHGGNYRVFTFHWSSDPRKDAAWYAKICARYDSVVVAQEYDINYQASVEGVILPSAWVQAAVNSHVKLNLIPSGIKRGALDVADEGIDKNAFCARHGNVLTYAESWRGKGSDIYATVERAFSLSDIHGLGGFTFDADGLGASVRGDARKINEGRTSKGYKALQVTPYRGSGAIERPEEVVPLTDRKAGDMFENFKVQAYWALRFRFQATYRAVVEGMPYNKEDIISIASDFPEHQALCTELSQPVFDIAKSGKLLVVKTPPGFKSPNLADAVCMLFAPMKPPMVISAAALQSTGIPYAAPHRQAMASIHR